MRYIRRLLLSVLIVGLGLFLLGVGLGRCTMALAQFQPQPQPPRGEGPNCLPVSALKADAQLTRIFEDNDGDWWVTVRFTSTGRILIGFVHRATGKFCQAGEGRVLPES